MVIIVESSYSTENVSQLARRYVELLEEKPVPDYLSMRGPYVGAQAGSGFQSLTLFEVDNDDLAKGLLFLSEFMASLTGIPGYTYHIRPWYDIDEALRSIGMA